jgi:DNA polymerase III subunit delta
VDARHKAGHDGEAPQNIRITPALIVVALKAWEIEKFLARPDPGRPIVLVFGPDAGLVRERAEALIRASIDDPRDPFQLARLDGDDLAGAPMRLVEEANTIPLFGGRRAVWVRAGARNFAPAVEALVGSAAPDCRVVIEAGELRRNAPLRAVCERARNAVALPCYPDAERDILHLIDEEMRENGLSISPDARAALVPLLGGDRLASRHELRKLALFAGGKSAGDKTASKNTASKNTAGHEIGNKVRVELEDVIAVVSDASTLTLDELIDAAFAGRTGELEVQLGKARTAATMPGTIMSAALRQVAQLHKARLAVEDGVLVSEAAGGIAPFVHFSRKAALEAALNIWTSARLGRAMTQLADAALETRRQSAMAAVITHRALLALAVNARRKE